jgi:hypothetical protein
MTASLVAQLGCTGATETYPPTWNVQHTTKVAAATLNQPHNTHKYILHNTPLHHCAQAGKANSLQTPLLKC